MPYSLLVPYFFLYKYEWCAGQKGCLTSVGFVLSSGGPSCWGGRDEVVVVSGLEGCLTSVCRNHNTKIIWNALIINIYLLKKY